MEFFHIKIFTKPKKIVSVVYLVEPDIFKSKFVKVEGYKSFLDRPGINPLWLNEVLEMQQRDLTLARKYVLREIENETNSNNCHISVGFVWDKSDYKHDEFMSRVIVLAGLD